MKNFRKVTNQDWEIIELWRNIITDDLFVIVKRKNDIAWGSYYNPSCGYWGQGHYDYRTIAQARFDMLSMYGDTLDLIKQNIVKGVNDYGC